MSINQVFFGFPKFVQFNFTFITFSGYQIRSRHAFLKMLTGTKKEEDWSFDNINNILITSSILMVLSCIMEVLIYFIYNNKV